MHDEQSGTSVATVVLPAGLEGDACANNVIRRAMASSSNHPSMEDSDDLLARIDVQDGLRTCADQLWRRAYHPARRAVPLPGGLSSWSTGPVDTSKVSRLWRQMNPPVLAGARALPAHHPPRSSPKATPEDQGRRREDNFLMIRMLQRLPHGKEALQSFLLQRMVAAGEGVSVRDVVRGHAVTLYGDARRRAWLTAAAARDGGSMLDTGLPTTAPAGGNNHLTSREPSAGRNNRANQDNGAQHTAPSGPPLLSRTVQRLLGSGSPFNGRVFTTEWFGSVNSTGRGKYSWFPEHIFSVLSLVPDEAAGQAALLRRRWTLDGCIYPAAHQYDLRWTIPAHSNSMGETNASDRGLAVGQVAVGLKTNRFTAVELAAAPYSDDTARATTSPAMEKEKHPRRGAEHVVRPMRADDGVILAHCQQASAEVEWRPAADPRWAVGLHADHLASDDVTKPAEIFTGGIQFRYNHEGPLFTQTPPAVVRRCFAPASHATPSTGPTRSTVGSQAAVPAPVAVPPWARASSTCHAAIDPLVGAGTLAASIALRDLSLPLLPTSLKRWLHADVDVRCTAAVKTGAGQHGVAMGIPDHVEALRRVQAAVPLPAHDAGVVRGLSVHPAPHSTIFVAPSWCAAASVEVSRHVRRGVKAFGFVNGLWSGAHGNDAVSAGYGCRFSEPRRPSGRLGALVPSRLECTWSFLAVTLAGAAQEAASPFSGGGATTASAASLLGVDWTRSPQPADLPPGTSFSRFMKCGLFWSVEGL